MCGSMVDIQSAAAEIRRGIKKEDGKKPQGKNIMSASATQGGHKNEKVTNDAENSTLGLLHAVENRQCRYSNFCVYKSIQTAPDVTWMCAAYVSWSTQSADSEWIDDVLSTSPSVVVGRQHAALLR